jgi:PAS domain S-box-containing protein
MAEKTVSQVYEEALGDGGFLQSNVLQKLLRFSSNGVNWKTFVQNALQASADVLEADVSGVYTYTFYRLGEVRITPLLKYLRLEDPPVLKWDENSPQDASVANEVIQQFQRNNPIHGPVRNLRSEELKKLLTSLGYKTILYVPIWSNDRLWGCMCFHDKTIERIWPGRDVDFLQSVARLIGQSVTLNNLKDEVKRKDEVLNMAMEKSLDGTWELDLSNNVLTFSDSFKRMLNYEPAEFQESIGAFERLIHPDEREKVLGILDPYEVADTGSVELQYRLRNKFGKYIWVLTKASVLFDKAGKPQTFRASNIDITSKILYLDNLKKKEQEYRNLVNTVHEVIFRVDEEGAFTFVNPAWELLTGFSAEKSQGQHFINYVDSEDRYTIRELLFSQSDREKSAYENMEIRFLTTNGNYRWMEVFTTITYYPDGKYKGAFGTMTDIHKRKEAELAQKETEERFRFMSESMSDLVSLHSITGTIYYVSPSINDILNLETYDLIGRNSSEFLNIRDLTKIKKEIIEPLKKGQIEKGVTQIELKRSDGSTVWCETVIQPLRNEGGIDSLMAVTRDISERKKAEEEMQNALIKEKELNEFKSRFISMASHEFRTPLTSIKSSVDMMEMYADELDVNRNKPFVKHCDKIGVQISRLTNLMNDVLILGRTEANKMPFAPEPLDLVAFIMHFIEQNYLNLEDGRTVTLSVEGFRRDVVLDESLFSHILGNAISNAFKYSKGKPNPEVKVQYDEDFYSITIKDHGIGIPKKEQANLFESFFRAENTTGIEGTGLGLVIMKQFVEMHQGTIEIDSAKGKGTSVIMTFPYQPG